MCVALSSIAQAVWDELRPTVQTDLEKCLVELLYVQPEHTVPYVDEVHGLEFLASMVETSHLVVWRWMDDTERENYNRAYGKQCSRAILIDDLLDGLDYPGLAPIRRR